MSPPFQPLQLLLVMFAGWVNRHQLDLIAYLQEENRVLTELFNADGASAECSATTIGSQPDECRFFFWTIRPIRTH
jgi:hypothetical protein